jgi:hypothetical protein
MVVEAQLGFDNAYNKRLNELNRQLDNMDVITHNPQMLGGGALQRFVSPGNNGQVAPVDQLAAFTPRLLTEQKSGGKISRIKKARRYLDFSEDVANRALGLAAKAKLLGGKKSRIKKAKRYLDFSEDAANRALGLAAKANLLGGKISRIKKANRYLDFSEDAADRGIGLAAKAKLLGGKRPPSARALIVKKVMADKGLSLIEASKYVKAHGLYTPK